MCQCRKRDVLSSSQIGGGQRETVSPPVSKGQNNHLHGPQLQAQLEKGASTSFDTIGARSSFSGARLAHEFPRSFLVAASIFPHTKCLKRITDYRDTPALKLINVSLPFPLTNTGNKQYTIFALSATPTTPAHTVQLGRCKSSIGQRRRVLRRMCCC